MQADPTVFVIDDDEAMRDSLAVLLESAGYSCRTFDSARIFLDSGPGDRPGCIVTDVRMPDMTGLELQQELGRRRIATPLIILTGYGNVAMAVAALRAGAVTFLEKPFDDQALIDSVRDALDRDGRARRERREAEDITGRFAQLTPREREVMELVVEGHPNKVIGTRLDISARTVEIHRARVMEKTGARNLPYLIRMVLRVRAEGS